MKSRLQPLAARGGANFLALLLAGTASPLAWAQQSPAPVAKRQVEDVVVTAQRRSQAASKVPLSITTISSKTIQKFGIEDFTDYAKLAPNLSFSFGVGGGQPGITQSRVISIRGIAGPNTTSFYIDDTPLPQSIDPHLLDVNHIEVLRGPQGTLFGASSMGGTVRVITQPPSGDQITGHFDTQAFNVNKAPGTGGEFSGLVNIPLVKDQLVATAFLSDGYTPGYFERTYNDPAALNVTGQLVPGPVHVVKNVGAKREQDAGVSIRFTPTAVPGLTITPMFLSQQTKSNGLPLADYDSNNLIQRRILNEPEAYRDQYYFVALTASYKMDLGRFVSSSSWFSRQTYDQEDGSDGNIYQLSFSTPTASLPNPYEPTVVPSVSSANGRETSLTQEVRFESTLDFPVNFVVGGFYQDNQTTLNTRIYANGLVAESGGYFPTDNIFSPIGATRQTQIAGFAGVNIVPIRNMEIQLGVRESYLTNYFNLETGASYFDQSGSSYGSGTSTTPRASVKYNFTPETMAYATFAEGFRVGGGNPPLGPSCEGLGLPTTTGIPYASDNLYSYELGLKSALFNNTVSVSTSVYHIDWDNVQQTQTVASGSCFALLTENLGTAVSNGVEVESTAKPLDNLTLHAAAGYEDAHLTAINPATAGTYHVGESLSGVPKWTASVSADYEIPRRWGNYFLRGQYSFSGSSESYTEISSGLLRKAYQLADLRAGAQYGNYTFTIYVKNLTDARPNLSDESPEVAVPYSASGVGRFRYVVGQPRTVGGELHVDF